MQYQLLNDGVVVGTGSLQIDTGNYSTAAWARGEPNTNGNMTYYGFSGGGFDEVRLQDRNFPNVAFNPTSFEAAAIDSVSAVTERAAGVPDNSSTAVALLLGTALLFPYSLRVSLRKT
jgi:hypothetical protein